METSSIILEAAEGINEETFSSSTTTLDVSCDPVLAETGSITVVDFAEGI